ncbi:MAG: hypothetical protein FWH08_05390 [Oscillospiraceae bacterium]|nr:hypothetical protein [Oscillospiraceae bacterium]
MKKGLTELIVMHDNITPVPGFQKKAQKISAEFLATLSKAQTEERQIRFTGVLFGGGYKMVADDVPIGDVKSNPDDFTATGTRDIFDSAAKAIIEKGSAYGNKHESEHPENIIFVIVAFGRDNASKSFTYSQVADMVRHQSEVYKWKFFCLTTDSFVSEQFGLGEDFVILLDYGEDDYFSDALKKLSERIMNIIDPPPPPPPLPVEEQPPEAEFQDS